jgi:hypothetical protein
MLGILDEEIIKPEEGDERDPSFGEILSSVEDGGQEWVRPIIARWAYMDYQIKSFLEDLLKTGECVWEGGYAAPEKDVVARTLGALADDTEPDEQLPESIADDGSIAIPNPPPNFDHDPRFDEGGEFHEEANAGPTRSVEGSEGAGEGQSSGEGVSKASRAVQEMTANLQSLQGGVAPKLTALEFAQKYPDADINDYCLEDIGCPKCGSRDGFKIAFSGELLAFDSGTEDAGDHEWESDSSCICTQCGHGGKVRDFTFKGLDDILELGICRECGDVCDGGGEDGLCGNCADRAENKKKGIE